MTDNHLATGQHLLIDAAGTNSLIASRESLEDFVDALMLALDMDYLGELCVERVEKPGNRGYTAFQLITTSHISLHADEIGMGFYLDIFSCRPFDNEKVLTLVRETFEPKQTNYLTVQRAIS